jgi:hypothetical protein
VTSRRIRYRPAVLYGAGTTPGLVPVARAVHLVDAENLLGTPAPSPAQVRHLISRYAARVGFGPMDQVIIACSHLAFQTIGFCWPGPQYLLRSGLDGADLALLAVLDTSHIAARFADVVIGSGDHIFAPAVTGLTTAGCWVTVATRRDRLSASLARAASPRLIYLNPPRHIPPASTRHNSQARFVKHAVKCTPGMTAARLTIGRPQRSPAQPGATQLKAIPCLGCRSSAETAWPPPLRRAILTCLRPRW